MKILQISFVAMLMIIGTSFAATAKTINLLENFATSDETQMCNKSNFYEKWECYWKEGESVPEESRPSSYYSIVKLNEQFGQLMAQTAKEGTMLYLSGSRNAGFEDNLPIVVLDFPSSSNGTDFYYRIPINVPQSGEYKLTGSLYNVDCHGTNGTILNLDKFNFATELFAAIFTSENTPCKKSFNIVATESGNRIQATANGNYKYSGFHIVRYDKINSNEINVKPMETYIQLDKEDKYLCIYAPPTLENYQTKSVLVLGNMRLEPVDPIIEPEPEAEPDYFKHFARTLFVGESYNLGSLGLEVPKEFDAQASGLTVTCDDNRRIELTGEGLSTEVKALEAHIYDGSEKGLPYATLTVSYLDEKGAKQSTALRLHVPSHVQITWSDFDFTQADHKVISNLPGIYMNSDTGAWKANFASDDSLIDDSDTSTPISKSQPTYTYLEGKGWQIDFGSEVGRCRLHLEANAAESHYAKNPAYAMNELKLYIDPTSSGELRVLAVEQADGKTEYKELEIDGEGVDTYYEGYDASICKDIIIEASGSLILKNIKLSFVSNFEIPKPSFMNVENELNYTYILYELPKDENGNDMWDNNHKLQIEYLIEPDVNAEPKEELTIAAYSDTPEWTKYSLGSKVTFGSTEKLTAHVVHPHGMISLPNQIAYFVITNVKNLPTDDADKINDINNTRYFTLQGIETSEPCGSVYIMVKAGKSHLIRN